MKKQAIFFLLPLTLCGGCGAKVTENNLSQVHFVKYDDMLEDKTQEERAYAIKQRLGQIEGLSGSAVVVEGHTAIIGLRAAEALEQAEVNRLRREADMAARAADKQISSTSITTNSRIVGLIEEMERKREG